MLDIIEKEIDEVIKSINEENEKTAEEFYTKSKKKEIDNYEL